MRKLLCILLLFSLPAIGQNGNNAPVKAFFTADGPGKVAIGGRGRALGIVTSLDQDAACSGALTNTQGETYYTGGIWCILRNPNIGHVVFNVSGYIELTKGTGSNTSGTARKFSIPRDGSISGVDSVHHKTIYGQSAPQGGITFSGGQLRIAGKYDPIDGDNLIVRYIRSRPIYDRYGNIPSVIDNTTDDALTWAFAVKGGDSVMVDHCSFSWSWDKVFGSLLDNNDIPGGATLYKHTYQFNLMGDGHTGSFTTANANLANDPELYMDAIAYHKNIMYASNRSPNFAFNGDGEIMGNVIFDIPYKYTRSFHDIRVRHIGNYYLEPSGDLEFNWIEDSDASTPVIHSSGNYAVGTVNRDGVYVQAVNFDGTVGQLNKELWTDNFQGAVNLIDNANWSATDFTFAWTNESEWTAQQAYDSLVVAGNVGAYQYLDDNGVPQVYRDTYDQDVLDNIAAGTRDARWMDPTTWLTQKPTLPTNTRPGTYDTDNDGMADAWEVREYGDLTQGYSGDFDSDGYQNIEEYMNQVDGVTGDPATPPGPSNPTNAAVNLAGRIRAAGGSKVIVN